MAQSPQSNEAFFREVTDEVRREQMAGVARRYGVTAILVALIALLAFGGWLFWQHERELRAAERGEQFTAALTALSKGDAATARAKVDPLVASGARGYAPLGRLLIADMAAQQGKGAASAAAFADVADDRGAPQPLRDLALIRATTADFDRLAPQAVIDRMKPLRVAGAPWAGSAGELTALAQIKLGQIKPAGATILAVVRDPTVPESLRERLSQIGGDLGVDATVAAVAGAARP